MAILSKAKIALANKNRDGAGPFGPTAWATDPKAKSVGSTSSRHWNVHPVSLPVACHCGDGGLVESQLSEEASKKIPPPMEENFRCSVVGAAGQYTGTRATAALPRPVIFHLPSKFWDARWANTLSGHSDIDRRQKNSGL